MADLSKVIAGLEACLKSNPRYCFGCPHEGAEYCHDEMFTDALEAIKDLQEKLKTAKDGRLELGRRLRDGND